MPQAHAGATLDLIDNFPAFEKAAPYIRQMILERHCKSIADVGGGANPLLDEAFIVRNQLEYFLIDKSAHELSKAGAHCRKVETDAACGLKEFRTRTADAKFDLIFSHMLLEHLADPLQAHRNFYDALKPGGRCVHIYPSPNNLPLMLNRVLPEAVSMRLLRLAQPARDLKGSQRKFKAYYRMCGAPGPAMTAAFEALGYKVVQHTGFIGNTYYARFRPAAMLERQSRKLAHRFQFPLTGGCLLVLEKRA